MKIPGPDHPITIALNPRRVRITAGGKVIAETARALVLQEASYPAVQYIPRADADMTLLSATHHHTHCPYKGDAGYFTIHAGGETGIAVAFHGVGSQGNDPRAAAGGLLCPYLSGGLQAVHLRHLHIHQDDVVGLAFE